MCYSRAQVTAALAHFVRSAIEGDTDFAIELFNAIAAGDLEVVAIVDGEFVYRLVPRADAKEPSALEAVQ